MKFLLDFYEVLVTLTEPLHYYRQMSKQRNVN